MNLEASSVEAPGAILVAWGKSLLENAANPDETRGEPGAPASPLPGLFSYRMSKYGSPKEQSLSKGLCATTIIGSEIPGGRSEGQRQ